MTDSNWQENAGPCAAWDQFWEDARSADILESAQRLLGAKLKPEGPHWVGPCPAGCAKRDGFIVTPAKGRGIFLCRPSVATGDVINMVEHGLGCSRVEAAETITGRSRPDRSRDETSDEFNTGLAKNAERQAELERRKEEQRREEEAKKEHDDEAIDDILKRALDLDHPDAEPGRAYLQARGLNPHKRLLKEIKFVAELGYYGTRENSSGKVVRLATLPAIIAIIRDSSGARIGISQAYLDPNAPRKWKPEGSPTNSPRKIKGEKKGGMIVLGRIGERLAVGEGWETCLAWDQLKGMGFFGDTLAGEDIALRAAVDLGNLAGGATGSVPHPFLKDANGKPARIANGVPDPNAPGWVVPEGIKEVRLLGDYDSEVFFTAAKMAVAARRHMDKGREVYIHFPPTPGRDWNDQLLKGEDDGPAEPAPLPANATYAEKVAGFRHPTHMETGEEYLARVSFLFDPPQPRSALTWHGENINEPLVEWAVEDMFYKVGIALIAGQWGTYKTFVAIDLAASIMTKTPFAGRAVHRQGGVLFIAAEGQAQVPIRLKGVALGKVAGVEPSEDAVKIDPEKMPFAWARRSPPLSNPEAFGELRTLVAEAARGMQDRFGLPLALIVIDALMPAAQFRDADKSTESRQVMDMLAAVARDFEILMVVIDHFGKDVSTGTRNASTKEDAADSILALLGERSLEGKVSNPRMAIRKVKGSEQGVVFPFGPREVAVGETGGGKPLKTYVIDWQTVADDDSASGKPAKGWPKSLLIFKRALDKTLSDVGKRMRPFHDGPEVLAAPAGAVRAEFLKAYPTEAGDPKLKAKAKAKAFERAIKQAVAVNLVCSRDLAAHDFETFYWRIDVE
jgi:hypothetical protein